MALYGSLQPLDNQSPARSVESQAILLRRPLLLRIASAVLQSRYSPREVRAGEEEAAFSRRVALCPGGGNESYPFRKP
jgi:hypothetical protein